MTSLLNASRPPVFCPGCAHDRMVQAVDRALQNMGFVGEDVAMVSDIGCSGLFDTFFNTHALHGLHGRALTYAAGIKMARPELKVIVIMGDGGLGIGGAHLLSACRRNLDLTLLVLNNFNYGMTGGQCSSTTPRNARVGSGFLNRLEKPIDVCQVAGAAGAPFVTRASAYESGLVEKIEKAIRFGGFALVDVWGICPGRFAKQNKMTPQSIEEAMAQLPSFVGLADENAREEYGRAYRAEAERIEPAPAPARIDALHRAPQRGRIEVVILGSAGQRILTAGEILCLAGATAGLRATQKSDYPITVMRGHSITEIILDESEIGYTGIDRPRIVIALAKEGVNRRKACFGWLPSDVLVLKAAGVDLPSCTKTVEIDFRAHRLKPQDWALAALGWLAAHQVGITKEMLHSALGLRFRGNALESAIEVAESLCSSEESDPGARAAE